MVSHKAVTCVLFYTCFCKISANHNQNEFCQKHENGVTCDKMNPTLTHLDGGEVGNIKEIVLSDGSKLEMKTLSLKPVLFELPGFLSDEECSHFLTLAKHTGLRSSGTFKVKTNHFRIHDMDGDRKLTLTEMRVTIEELFDVYLSEDDILNMYNATKMDADNDELITFDELKKVSPYRLRDYVIKEHPEKRARQSNSALLFPAKSTDAVFQRVQKRVSEVIELPVELIKLSTFQIVHYGVNGYYNAHYDSHKKVTKTPCCMPFGKKPCRMCRYMSILLYLNDVEEGGETAFPEADNETYNYIKLKIEEKSNLFLHCDKAKLKVLPVKGKAVMWYNHFVDKETQWLGKLDIFSIHGGCRVKKGEKWIGTFWITLTDNKEEDTKRIAKLAEIKG